jgi:hypothetical protein
VFVNVPIVPVAPSRPLVRAHSRDPAKPSIDYVGAALSVVGLSALVWSIIEVSEQG